jgi:hypothetical protein
VRSSSREKALKMTKEAESKLSMSKLKLNKTFDLDKLDGKYSQSASNLNTTICFTAEAKTTGPPKPKAPPKPVEDEGIGINIKPKGSFWVNFLKKFP